MRVNANAFYVVGRSLPPSAARSYAPVINPRRACAARVTVLGLCVCLSVCLGLHAPATTPRVCTLVPFII